MGNLLLQASLSWRTGNLPLPASPSSSEKQRNSSMSDATCNEKSILLIPKKSHLAIRSSKIDLRGTKSDHDRKEQCGPYFLKNPLLMFKNHFLFFSKKESLPFWKKSQDDEIKQEELSRCKSTLRRK
jgi:hypothetical protein